MLHSFLLAHEEKYTYNDYLWVRTLCMAVQELDGVILYFCFMVGLELEIHHFTSLAPLTLSRLRTQFKEHLIEPGSKRKLM